MFLNERGVSRFSVLAVPEFHHGQPLTGCPESVAWLNHKAADGADIVLHGYFHDRADRQGGSLFWTRLYTANEAEFLDLSDDEVRDRLQRGSAIWLARGWRLSGFIAPAWLMPREQDALLGNAGFTYTTRLGSISDLAGNREIPAQSLCYSTRAPWRRLVSRLWNPMLLGTQRRRGVIRLSLHPNDLKWDPIRRQVGAIIEKVLSWGFEPTTYADYVAM
jgi:predicted deacetylase